MIPVDYIIQGGICDGQKLKKIPAGRLERKAAEVESETTMFCGAWTEI